VHPAEMVILNSNVEDEEEGRKPVRLDTDETLQTCNSVSGATILDI